MCFWKEFFSQILMAFWIARLHWMLDKIRFRNWTIKVSKVPYIFGYDFHESLNQKHYEYHN